MISRNGVWICLPAVGKAFGAAGSAASPWRSWWRLHRHTRTLKRIPAVFRPRAARSDDGARRLVETPRSFRCRRAEPIAPRRCPCPAKDAFGIGGNNRGTKQGSVSDVVHSRRSRVQAFAPHAADQAFHIRILPWASWRRDDLFHAHRHHGRAPLRIRWSTIQEHRDGEEIR